MKKITTILMLLMLSIGVWAEDGTIVVTSGNAMWTSNDGAYTNAKVWTSSAAGKPTVTITGASQKNTNAWNTTNGVLMCRNNTSDGGKVTLTLSIAGNYRITGFDIKGKGAFNTFTNITITSNNQTATCTGTSVDDQVPATLNVTDLYTTSTTIEIRETQNLARGIVTDFVVYYVEYSDFTSNVEAEIKPWIESIGNGYFTLDPTNTDVQALRTFYNSHTGDTWSQTDYNDLLDLLNTAKASGIKMPETGYYRLKANTVSGRPEGYIGYSQTTLPNYENRGIGLRNIAIEDAKTDASTILKLTKVEGGYTISTEGLYVLDNETQGKLFPVTDVEANAAVFVISATTPGLAFIGTATNSKQWGLHNSDWNAIVGWTNTEPSFWILEDAAKLFGSGSNVDVLQLPLTEIDGKYYATTCLPFPAQIMEADANAYKVTLNGKKAVEELIGNKIPAFEPVLLISEVQGTLSIAIPGVTISGAEPEAVTGNQLKGVLVKTAQADLQGETPVVLNQSGGKVGFYKLADGSSLSANRAYLSYDEGSTPQSAKAFFEEGFELGGNEATAIENIENGAFENGAVYNLQGQRVTKAQKGVFIVNGKKIVK